MLNRWQATVNMVCERNVLNLGVCEAAHTYRQTPAPPPILVSATRGNFDCESWSFGHDKLDRQSYPWNVLASRSLRLPVEVKHFESVLVIVVVVSFEALEFRNGAGAKHNMSAHKSPLLRPLSLSLRSVFYLCFTSYSKIRG